MFWKRKTTCCCQSCQSTCQSCQSCCKCCCQTTCQSCCSCCSCQSCQSCCSCCSCQSCQCQSRQNAPQVETWYYAARFIDVPMSTYYGEGYTEIDCCVDTKNVLKEISDTLKQTVRRK